MTLRLIYPYVRNSVTLSSLSVFKSHGLKLNVTPSALFQLQRVERISGFRNYSDEAATVSKEDKKPAEEQRDPKIRDPTKEVSVETSMRYLKSTAYRDTYGGQKVWVLYRRNFPGQFAPKKTREKCYINGRLNTGNPCPICRDEYLVLDYRNVDLLKQFISPFNGAILGYDKTGLCQERHFKLLVEIDKAKNYGTISFDVPFREFNYEEYYPKEALQNLRNNSTNPNAS